MGASGVRIIDICVTMRHECAAYRDVRVLNCSCEMQIRRDGRRPLEKLPICPSCHKVLQWLPRAACRDWWDWLGAMWRIHTAWNEPIYNNVAHTHTHTTCQRDPSTAAKCRSYRNRNEWRLLQLTTVVRCARSHMHADWLFPFHAHFTHGKWHRWSVAACVWSVNEF